jgi:tRNA nucleotidyltransferase/poly(A) polymerase
MKRRLIKKFNEVYFKNIPNAKNALTVKSKIQDFNKKSTECTQNKEALNILSDLVQVQNNNIIHPYSNTLTDILWNLSASYVTFHKAYKSFPDSVKKLCKELNYLSDNSCFVGGCVRDTLIGKEPHDFDFVSDVNYDALKYHLESVGYNVQEKGEQFLVLIVSDSDGNQFEIANYRKEGSYTDGRRPDIVDIGTIDDDAARRDFSVNAGYVSTKTLKVQDPSGFFMDDLLTRTLRFIGNPKDRITEDFLRGWRFYRFISKGFNPDKASLKAVRANWNEIYMKSTPERVRLEMEKLTGL